MNLNILIADDHPIIRVGIKYLLRDNFENASIVEACNGDQVMALLKDRSTDVMLMDLNMPDTNPQELLQRVLMLAPGLGVIIFSMNKEEIYGRMYLEMGAMGYLKKGCEEKEIIKAVKCVSEGDVYMTKEMRSHYLVKNNSNKTGNAYAALTKKEKEVLRHLSKGEPAVNICRIMNIGSSTVATHKASIMEKLKVKNMFDLKSVVELYPL